MATALKLAPPPSADAAIMTIDETAGLLRISRGTLNKIRRADTTFPQPRLVGGLPRFLRKEVVAWVEAQPAGWTTRGGDRSPKEVR
jgi:predicted DNA-binding transcriptional regulator AlpA